MTGGTGGIGSRCAIELATKGFDIASWSRAMSVSDDDRQAIQGTGSRYVHVPCDVAVPASVSAAFEETRRILGDAEVVVHAAGGRASGRLDELTHADWQKALDTHLTSAFTICQGVLPQMRRLGHGCIVLVASAAAMRAPADAIAYSTAKAALIQFSRCLASDVASEGIRVNVVSPGFVNTPFHRGGDSTPNRGRIPIGRFGTAQEVSDVVCAIVENGYIVGANILIDGGVNLDG